MGQEEKEKLYRKQVPLRYLTYDWNLNRTEMNR